MAKAKGHNPAGHWQMCLVSFIQCCESSPILYKKPDFQFLLQNQKTWQDRPESLPQRHLEGTYSPVNEEAPLPTPPRGVPGERGHLSSCIWNLGVFSERCTEKLPLRVDCIHRLEFGEVSGHRPYMTTGKTIALTRRTFVGKVMSLLFNMLSRLVITFLPRSKRL